MPGVERRFKRELRALDDVFAFVDEFVADDSRLSTHSFPLRLAVEEIFVNMVTYNASGEGEIVLELHADDRAVTIILEDLDSEPFDITQHEAESVQLPPDQRKPGGLGIHLVKRMMDEVHYDYSDRRTRIRLVKRI